MFIFEMLLPGKRNPCLFVRARLLNLDVFEVSVVIRADATAPRLALTKKGYAQQSNGIDAGAGIHKC